VRPAACPTNTICIPLELKAKTVFVAGNMERRVSAGVQLLMVGRNEFDLR
jgi:hypothetical protein